MSRFEKLTHVLWHCQLHIVWVPKYRFRILKGPIAREVYSCVQVYGSQLGCRVEELNVQMDNIHLLVKVPPIPYLKQKPYWGNHFWDKGYCVDTVGVDGDVIREYVKYQEKQEHHQVQMNLTR